MKRLITQMQLRTAIIFLLCSFCLIQLNAQISPEETVGGVTEAYYLDGGDTIWLEYDTETGDEIISADGDNIIGGGYNSFVDFEDPPTPISITFGNDPKPVSKGLFGYHVGGMFDNSTLPNEPSSQYGWQVLSDLRPEVLRFPAGSYSKFTHLLHNTDSTDSKGYGYDLAEIIRYFDKTDGSMENYDVPYVLANLDDDDLEIWMDSNRVEHFQNYVGKCLVQDSIPDSVRYIDDFIDLIHFIEDNNAGHTVKVIVCLNILSETASECKNIIEYLKDNEVTVAYAEMGNECYADIFEQAMGFSVFNDYYDYLRGENWAGYDTAVFTDAMLADHDYLHTFKSGLFSVCKVALVAEGLGSDYDLFSPDPYTGGSRTDYAWNDSLYTKYSDTIVITPLGYPHARKAFDAVIIHPYYAKHSWDSCAIDNLDVSYACGDTATDQWQYDTYDSRLADAFSEIRLNFKRFYRTNYKESYDAYSAQLHFENPASTGKDLITSEWNFKDEEDVRRRVYTQTFMHGTIFWEWWLKNVKLNYDNDYRHGFFTYATVQNFAGGAGTDLISPANKAEREFFGVDIIPFENGSDPKREYHVKRTTLFAAMLLSEITKNNLQYLKSNIGISAHHINNNPTAFIDPDKEYIYLYYSNGLGNTQDYPLNTTTLTSLFPGATGVDLGDAIIYCVNALMPYSTAGEGKNSLFDMNDCYDSIPFPIEIIQIDTIPNEPECELSIDSTKCMSVPAVSFGFIKIPLLPQYKLANASINQFEEITLYPNPTGNDLLCLNENCNELPLRVEIYTMQGVLCSITETAENEKIDVNLLPAGIYEVFISAPGHATVYKPLVKQ